MNKLIEYGGLGMMDLADLDKGLKLKALSRLSESSHPLLNKVREALDLEDFFHPKVGILVEKVAVRGVELLKEIRAGYVGDDMLAHCRLYIAYIKNIKLERAISSVGKGSIGYFALRQAGLRRLGELDAAKLQSIGRFLNRNLHNEARRVLNLNGDTLLMQSSSQLNLLGSN